MVWQDIVIMIANFALAISLLPQIIHGFQNKKGYIKLSTSAPTCIAIYSIGVALFSLGLWWASFATALSATFWLVLIVQRMVYENA